MTTTGNIVQATVPNRDGFMFTIRGRITWQDTAPGHAGDVVVEVLSRFAFHPMAPHLGRDLPVQPGEALFLFAHEYTTEE